MEIRSQILAARISLVVSILLFLIALAAGLISDSVTLMLDAAVAFISLFMSVILYSNIRKINRPPDLFFHFGYEKFEPLTVMIQGVLIMSSCLIALYFAVQDIIHAEDVTRYDIPFCASIISAILALSLAFFIRRISLKTHSHMLKASSLHWLVDSLFSVGMILGFGLGMFLQERGYRHLTPYVDPIMTIILGGVFVWMPLKIIRFSLGQLLDVAPPQEINRDIEQIIERHKSKIFGVRSMRLRKAGEKLFLYICFGIHHNATIRQAHEFVKDFEIDINRAFPKCDLIVYFYPEAG